MALKTQQAIVNGVEYDLTYNEQSGYYEAAVTAPGATSYTLSGGYYPVTLKATDNAGNTATVDATDSALGAKLRLDVYEKVAPVIAITSPSSGASITSNKPAITFTVTDSGSGVKESSIKLVIDSGSAITGAAITKTAITNGFRCTYTPSTALSDGSHAIKVNASDNDGNAATQKTSTFKVDTVPPTLSVTAPVNNFETNATSVTVTGSTNDAAASPVTLKINGTAVTVASNRSFSKAITLTEGSNTITVVATDGAGKTSTVARTVILDTIAPVFSDPIITPNPVGTGDTFVLKVKITD